MQILIIGNGGREHALGWKVAQSPKVEHVYIAPGNPGAALEAGCEKLPIEVDDIDGLVRFARDRKIDITIVGPEVPLVAGVVDRFQEVGLKIFGPNKASAQLEGSKAFTKDFLTRHNIPTAKYGSFTDANAAIEYIKKVGAPIVVKADGLAAGKGVIIAQTEAEAIRAIKEMLESGIFGRAGARIVVEEFLAGEEVSFIVMADGKHVLPLASSQDHKRVDNGDQGPNTGGMGAYSPAPAVTPEMHDRIMHEIIEPTVRGMEKEGQPYTGFLYAGVMITASGPKVLEYNCRFGDPETQPILMRLKSDFVELIEAALAQRLDKVKIEWDKRAALGVVMVAAGYPWSFPKGEPIIGLPFGAPHCGEDWRVFHSGTALSNGKIVTNGGRVLCVTALGDTVGAAQRRAYEVVQRIRWDNLHYRTDIGYRAIEREQKD